MAKPEVKVATEPKKTSKTGRQAEKGGKGSVHQRHLTNRVLRISGTGKRSWGWVSEQTN